MRYLDPFGLEKRLRQEVNSNIAHIDRVGQTFGMANTQQRYGLNNAEYQKFLNNTDPSLPVAVRAAMASGRSMTIQVGNLGNYVHSNTIASTQYGFNTGGDVRFATGRPLLATFNPDGTAQAFAPLKTTRARRYPHPSLGAAYHRSANPYAPQPYRTDPAGTPAGYAPSVLTPYNGRGTALNFLAHNAVLNYDESNILAANALKIRLLELSRDASASTIPFVGEGYDIATIGGVFTGQSSPLEGVFATGSLGLSVVTAGMSPNFGAVARNLGNLGDLTAGAKIVDRTPSIASSQRMISTSGDPFSIMFEGASLNTGQRAILGQLDGYGSEALFRKGSVGLSDLAALTAYTGDEFAMFTLGGRRLIVRGDAGTVPISIERASQMGELGWRWSGHTHPGTTTSLLMGSPGDMNVMRAFSQTTGQNQSVILNSLGDWDTFTTDMSGWLPR